MTLHIPLNPFVKSFEDDYLLSRELQILTDLGQRAAPVPRVLATDHRARTITMEHRGLSLTEVIDALPSQQGQRVAWLRHHGPQIMGTIAQVSDLGVYHLDLSCRNILMPESPILIDFGLALCPRFPLQKPLWVQPSKTLHHPELRHALEKDWQVFFAGSSILKAHYARIGQPYPPDFDQPFELPRDAYAAYWPDHLVVNDINTPMRLVAFGAGHLLGEMCHRMGLTGPDANVIARLQEELQTDSASIPPREKLDRAAYALAQLGGTPMPGYAQPMGNAYHDSPQASRTEPIAPPPKMVASGHGLWRVLCTGLFFAGYGLIDLAYRFNEVILGDMAFFAALVVAGCSLIMLASLAHAQGILIQRVMGLLLIGLSLPFAAELLKQGVPIIWLMGPAVSFGLGLWGLLRYKLIDTL